MITENLLSVLTQSGSVGVSLCALWLLYKIVCEHLSHSNSVIEKNTDVIHKNNEAILSLEKVIESKL